MSSIPQYTIRNIDIIGPRDQDEFIDFLCNPHQIKTGTMIAINAEKLITAEQHHELKVLIDDAEYKYADGISIVKSIRKKYPDADVKRIAGADLWQGLMQRAGELSIPVFLIGATPIVLEQTKHQLELLWNVNVVGYRDGYFGNEERLSIFEQIENSGAKIITVALGSPKQELFMRDCHNYYKNALYMGVGGTYDVFVGKVKRAPKIWQEMGLEWLYRLLTQPTRWRRQLKLIKFACYYFMNKL